jgi:4-hydroxy-3-polyprenylbenzoate decarboxylase
MKNLIVAMTGASGSIYAVRLIEVLLAVGRNVQLTISPAAAQVFHREMGTTIDLENFDPSMLTSAGSDAADDSKLKMLRTSAAPSMHVMSSVFSEDSVTVGLLTYHHYRDFSAGIASGSFPTDGMVICPCSMGTLGAIAGGLSTNLIHRAADVHLKERRRLIVVPRETPLGSIPLGNMQRLAEAGAVVLPAMPGFYHNPLTIHDLVDFVVGRICDQLGIAVDLFKRWGA